MKKKQSLETKWLGVGILAAIAAALCCITPVLAVLGGLGSIAATFSFLEPVRPYLIGLTVIVLGYAFYKAYKPKKETDIECACETDEKPKFINSKKFLWTILIVSAALFSFPYYSGALFPTVETVSVKTKPANIVEAKIYIEGMTCTSCEHTIDYSLKTTNGVLSATSSYETGVAYVKYDGTKAKMEDLVKAITERAGYKVKDYQLKKNEDKN
ncbi:MAG: mercuric transport protein MerTP [Melioribacteraceae bacterium]